MTFDNGDLKIWKGFYYDFYYVPIQLKKDSGKYKVVLTYRTYGKLTLYSSSLDTADTKLCSGTYDLRSELSVLTCNFNLDGSEEFYSFFA